MSLKKIAFVVIVGCGLIAGCDDPKAANKENFQAAIQKYLDGEPALCLRLNLPTNVDKALLNGAYTLYREPLKGESAYQVEDTQKKKAIADQLVALGLLKSEAKTLSVAPNLFSPEEKVDVAATAYYLADPAQFTVEDRGFSTVTKLCTGKLKVTEITAFSEPADAMGMKVSRVNYKVTATDLAAWTNDSTLKAAYSGELQIKTERKTDVILTNEGWVERHLFK